MQPSRHDINYRTLPDRFANRAIVSMPLIQNVAHLIEGTDELTPEGILALAIVVESLVLNDKIIPADDDHALGPSAFPMFFDAATNDLLSPIGEAVDADGRDSAANTINHEIAMLTTPDSSMRVQMVHGSPVYYEWWDTPRPHWEEWGQRWEQRARMSFSPEYIDLAKSVGCVADSTPWLVLANCHGIPYCSNVFYTVRDVANVSPTNIGLELYRQLEKLHESFFDRIQTFLGPTYVWLPPLLAIVLTDCSSRDDIPQAIMRAREKFSKLRRHCTKLEVDLRSAERLKEQFKIIADIEAAYAAVAKKSSSQKQRVLNRVFDVVKHIDPVQMGLSILEQAKSYDVEWQGLVKIPGYYNVYKASLDVEQALPLLKRLFGSEINPQLIAGLRTLTDRLARSRGVNAIGCDKAR